MAGVELAEDQLADSQEMSAVLTGEDTVGRDNLVTEGIGAKTVVREKNWVYLPPHEGPAIFADKGIETGCALQPQLYDLDADLGQRTDVAAQNPEKVAALDALLESIHGDTPPSGASTVNVSDV